MHIVTVNNLKSRSCSDTAIIQENTCACFCASNPTKLYIKLHISFKCGFDTGTDNFGRVFTQLSLTQDECFNGQVLVNSQLGRWCGVRTQPPHWITVIVDTSKWTNPTRWNWTPLTACCQSGCSCVKTFTVSTTDVPQTNPTPEFFWQDCHLYFLHCVSPYLEFIHLTENIVFCMHEQEDWKIKRIYISVVGRGCSKNAKLKYWEYSWEEMIILYNAFKGWTSELFPILAVRFSVSIAFVMLLLWVFLLNGAVGAWVGGQIKWKLKGC